MNQNDRWWFGTKYHQKLEEVIKREYDLIPTFSNPISWGYTTNAFYIKTNEGDFAARLSKNSPEKIRTIEKDIEISRALENVLPVPKYIKNRNGDYLSIIQEEKDDYAILISNSIIRLHKFIEGVLPFDMTENILAQCVDLVKTLHIFSVPIRRGAEDSLLHGDLTPSNFLVAYGKIVAVLDFEKTFVGPVEYDLSKMAVFFWFRMPAHTFPEIMQLILNRYDSVTINVDTLYKFSVQHAQNHLANIANNKKRYSNQKEWEKEYSFVKEKFAGILLLEDSPAEG